MTSIKKYNNNQPLNSDLSDYGFGGAGCFGVLSLGLSKFIDSKIPPLLATASLVGITFMAIFLRRQDIQTINELTKKNGEQEDKISDLGYKIQHSSPSSAPPQDHPSAEEFQKLKEENQRQQSLISSLEQRLKANESNAALNSSHTLAELRQENALQKQKITALEEQLKKIPSSIPQTPSDSKKPVLEFKIKVPEKKHNNN
ncbi:MAG: hypothetical protein JSR58_05160 [Verrucomicrobia bacterium]|nr:hypothetical protein [Verrucomicrobiota bacterium]